MKNVRVAIASLYLKKYWLLFSFLLLSGCLLPKHTEDTSSRFLNIELTGSHQKDNHIDVISSRGPVVLNINSASGIGKANISSLQNEWPAHVIFRLYLKGLESFSVSNGKLTITTSMLSRSPYTVLCEATMADQQRSVCTSKTSPYWMPARISSNDEGSSVIPLEEGYIEVALPDIILQKQPKFLSIQWIDFLR